MERILRLLLYASVLTPLIIARGMFFPFVAPRMLAFEGLTLVASLIWLYLWSRNPARYAPKITWLTIGIGVYILVSMVAAFQGVNFWRSFWSNFERMDGIFTWIALLLFFLVLGGVFKKREDWIWLFRLSLALSIVSALRSAQFFGLFEGTFILPTQMTGDFGSPIYVGVYAMFHVFIALFLLYSSGIPFKEVKDIRLFVKHRWALFYGIGLVMNLLVLFLTFARGPIIGFLLGVLLFGVFYGFYGGNRKLFLKMAGVILVVLAISFPFWKDSSLARRIYSVSAGLGADETRIINWNVAIQAFSAKPLLGWGSNNYTIAQNEFYNPHLLALTTESFDRTHNKYLEVVVDSGIIGLVSYLALFGVIGLRLFQERKKKPFLTALVAALFVAYLVQNITAFDNPASYLPFFLLLAFINVELFEPLRYQLNPKPWLIIGSWLLLVALVWQSVWQPYQANRTLAKVLSLQQREERDYVKILAGYRQALSYQTFGDSEIRMRLGVFSANESELTQDLLDLSIKELEKELAISDEEVRIHRILGELYERKAFATKNRDLLKNAQEHLLRAIELSPRRPDTYQHYAVFLINQEETEKAREELLKIQEFDKEIFESHLVQWYIGMTYYVENNLAKAYDQFQHMIDQGEEFSGERELLILGRVTSELGKYQEMVKWYEDLYRTNTENPQYSIYLALAYKQAGKTADAEAIAKRAAMLNPDLKDQVEEFIASLQ